MLRFFNNDAYFAPLNLFKSIFYAKNPIPSHLSIQEEQYYKKAKIAQIIAKQRHSLSSAIYASY
jgi:hypothetical protein